MSFKPKVGCRVRIKLDRADADFYETRVADVDKDYIYVDVPVHVRSGREMEVRLNQYLFIEYAPSDIEIYQYTSQLLGIEYIPIPAIRLTSPEKATDVERIERVQRREFFRISIDATVQIARGDGETIQAQAVDISGGGLAVVTEQTVPLEIGEVVMVHLTLPYIEYPLETACRMIRIEPNDQNEFVISMAFHKIKERERQQVIRYTFMRQRTLNR